MALRRLCSPPDSRSSTLKAQAQGDVASADQPTAARVQIDNDLFAGRDRDRDYTGGFAVTLSGERARDGLSLT